MTSDSSFTADVISETTPERLSSVLRKATEDRSDEQIARIERVQKKIKDLEARSLIKRQEYSAPTTGYFERIILHKKANNRMHPTPRA